MEPAVGRIVHFTPSKTEGVNPEPRAAIITYVHNEDLVNLHVFAQDGVDPEGGVQTSVEKKRAGADEETGYYWEWPKRED